MLEAYIIISIIFIVLSFLLGMWVGEK